MLDKIKLMGGMLAAASVAFAQPVTVEIVTDEDRWNYPFNQTPGIRVNASTFAALFEPGFDDYDAQFVVGFNTAGAATPGLAPACYRVTGARVLAVIETSQGVVFDPTFDSFAQFLPPGDPRRVEPDPGTPLELYGLGYRGVFPPGSDGVPVSVTAQTWTETSIFGLAPLIPPAFEQRFVFATGFDERGMPVNISNRFRDEFDALPLAIGTIGGLSQGDTIPSDSLVAFDIDLTSGPALRMIQDGLASGRLRFTIASAYPATGSDAGGGGGSGQFPIWYTRENPVAQILGFEPRLELTVEIRNPADLNSASASSPASPLWGIPDGILTPTDFSAFVSFFSSGDLRADLNSASASSPASPDFGVPDGILTPTDFAAFVFFFQIGC